MSAPTQKLPAQERVDINSRRVANIRAGKGAFRRAGNGYFLSGNRERALCEAECALEDAYIDLVRKR